MRNPCEQLHRIQDGLANITTYMQKGYRHFDD